MKSRENVSRPYKIFFFFVKSAQNLSVRVMQNTDNNWNGLSRFLPRLVESLTLEIVIRSWYYFYSQATCRYCGKEWKHPEVHNSCNENTKNNGNEITLPEHWEPMDPSHPVSYAVNAVLNIFPQQFWYILSRATSLRANIFGGVRTWVEGSPTYARVC